MTACLAGLFLAVLCTDNSSTLGLIKINVGIFWFFCRPNCFQIVVQHFSEEQCIFYFAGETPEQAQVPVPSLAMLANALSSA